MGRVNTTGLTLSVLDDPGRELLLGDVLQAQAGAFRPVSGVISSAHKGGRVWVRLCLKNTASIDDWVLNVLPDYIESVKGYEVNARKGAPEIIRLSPVENANYRGRVFYLDFSERQEKQLYLELNFSNRTMADIVLADRNAMHKMVAADYAQYGFYLGVTLLVVFINIALYVWFKELSYLYYALAALCLSGFTTLMGGYVFRQYQFWRDELTMPLILLFMSLFLAFFSLFVIHIYQLKAHFKKLYYVLSFSAAALVAVALVSVFLPGLVTYKLLSVFYFVVIPVYLYLILTDILWYRRHLLYSCSLLPLLIAFVLTSLRASGVSAYVPFADNLLGASALIHLVLINIALVRRAWQAESDKRAVLRSVLEKSKEYGVSLERKISLKTKGLLVANRHLNEEVCERKLAEKRLQEAVLFEQKAVQEKREMIALLSHEMRSPIAVIDLAVSNLMTVAPVNDLAWAERLSNIKVSVKKLRMLVDNYITNDRVSHQYSIKENCVGVDIRKLVDEAVHAIDLHSRVKVVCCEAAPVLNVEPGFMRIAISNLVDNALKYSDKAVTVCIATTEDGRVSISVQDQGEPISGEDRGKIFKKYYRSGRMHGRPGSGLGLYLVKSIAEAHEGRVELLPASLARQGNTFVIYLPDVMTQAVAGSKEKE